MSNKSRQKGDAYERRVVAWHGEAGISAERVPLSGAMPGYPGDVIVGQERWRGEVKARKAANGFKKVAEWLGDNDALFLVDIGTRHDPTGHPLVVLPWHRYTELMIRAGLGAEVYEETAGIVIPDDLIEVRPLAPAVALSRARGGDPVGGIEVIGGVEAFELALADLESHEGIDAWRWTKRGEAGGVAVVDGPGYRLIFSILEQE